MNTLKHKWGTDQVIPGESNEDRGEKIRLKKDTTLKKRSVAAVVMC